MDEKAHQLGIKEIFRTFLTDPFKGLSSEEARARQARDGFNEFEKTRHKTLTLYVPSPVTKRAAKPLPATARLTRIPTVRPSRCWSRF